MGNRKKLLISLFLIGIVLFSLNGILAEEGNRLYNLGVSFKPSTNLPLGGTAEISINFPAYSSYLYFYKNNSIVSVLNLNCPDDTCTSAKSLNYTFSASEFPEGRYILEVFRSDVATWIILNLNIGNPICSDDTPNKQCSITQPQFCQNGDLINNCTLCGCPLGQVCKEGTFCEVNNELPLIQQNTKDSFAYLDKEMFLVSDLDWKTVLPLVSVAIWTDNQGNVQKYPLLIFHEDDPSAVVADSSSSSLSSSSSSSGDAYFQSDNPGELVSQGNDYYSSITDETTTSATYSSYYSSSPSFDIDSIISFAQKYSPSRVTLVGKAPSEISRILALSPNFGAGLQGNQIQQITSETYLSYWKSFNSVIYVQDNYELALLASTYASLINAPLIINGSSLDSPLLFSGRKIICVGEVSPAGSSCSESYNLLSLRNKYKSSTSTDKIILVNPQDLSSFKKGGFYTDKGYSINQLYFKDSLISPILASANKELLISTNLRDYPSIGSFIHSHLSGINYLTIMGSETFIPSREFKSQDFGYDIYWALDPTHYADTNGDHIPDVAVGRISGISTSDVSSYVAKDLFYSSFLKTNNLKFLASSFGGYLAGVSDGIAAEFRKVGYNALSVTSTEDCYDFNPDEWKNQDLIYYTDHGGEYWSGIYSSQIPELENSLVFSGSCLTASTYDLKSFWARAIREGAIGYFGAVSVSYLGLDYIDTLDGIYKEGNDIGTAFKNAHSSLSVDTYGAMTTLIGDPTLNIHPPARLLSSPNIVCLPQDWPCLYNDMCCQTLECKWFQCNQCKTKNVFCSKNGDCCIGLECNLFSCSDCRPSGDLCTKNGDCCAGLECNLFSCKSCRAENKFCISDGDCCSDDCSWFTCD
jgi:hypothetical protein